MDLIIRDKDEVLVAFEKYKSTFIEQPNINNNFICYDNIIEDYNDDNNDNYDDEEENNDDDFFNDDNYHNNYNSQLHIDNIIICNEALSLIGISFYLSNTISLILSDYIIHIIHR
jgi:hypothetical protein